VEHPVTVKVFVVPDGNVGVASPETIPAPRRLVRSEVRGMSYGKITLIRQF
jgi:hypothetical protein